MDIELLKLIAQFWVPTILLFIWWKLVVKYLDKEQENHKVILEKKNELEMALRKEESWHYMRKLDLIVDRIKKWNSEILASNSEQRKDHKEILNTLKSRYNKVDIVVDDIQKDLKIIVKNTNKWK